MLNDTSPMWRHYGRTIQQNSTAGAIGAYKPWQQAWDTSGTAAVSVVNVCLAGFAG